MYVSSIKEMEKEAEGKTREGGRRRLKICTKEDSVWVFEVEGDLYEEFGKLLADFFCKAKF
jgi:hypothetical protein